MKSTRARRPTNSYKFKKYSELSKEVSGPNRKSYIALIVDGVLQLVSDASITAVEIQKFLLSDRTKRHVHAGKHLPKTVLRRIHIVQSKLESALICFQQGARREVDDQEAENILKRLAHAAEEILQVADSLAIFARSSIVNRLTLIHSRLQWIVSNSEAARLRLIPYTKRATAVTLPTNPNIVKPPPTRTLFDEDDDAALVPFLETAQKRGWRVTEKQVADTGEGQQVDVDLEDSFDLLWRLQKPRTSLLADDVIVGITQFPVISHSARRLPESIIRECLVPSLGYDFYLVLGDYMVIDKMCLLGIHTSIMKVQDERKRPKLDVEKFTELHPYLMAEEPEWAELLSQTHPIQPAKREGSHYYCPLIPTTILNKWGRGIGDWDFLSA